MNNSNNKKNNKKDDDGRLIIPFVIASIFIFTGIAVWLQFATSVELSATLITCFYAFCTGELWMLASIKKTKIKNDYNNNGIPDDEEGYEPTEDEIYKQAIEDALNQVRDALNNRGDRGGEQ